MDKNLAEFQLLGIDVKIHWSFVLILAWGALLYGIGPAGWLVGSIYGALTFALLFVCVTLHELGHALAARRYGIATRSILLLPIGGVANLERMPEKPRQELVIALAGPLVNVVIALLLLPLAMLLTGGVGDLLGGRAILNNISAPGLANLVTFLVSMNVWLVLFNLLPAFPMDGGRVLRAFLAMVMRYRTATRTAVLVGRLMAVGFAMFGIFSGNIGLLLVAFFVYVGGSAELEAVTSRAVLRNVRASSALTPGATQLYASERIGRGMELVMTTYQTDFPVLDLGGRFVGVLTRQRLVDALRNVGADARVVDVMLPADQIPVVTPAVDLAHVWEVMAQSGGRVVAVQEGANFLGVITSEDIAEVFQLVGATLDNKDRRPPDNTVAAPNPEQRVDA
jgi:Zn-dependent protease/predicted transcriptional regulator